MRSVSLSLVLAGFGCLLAWPTLVVANDQTLSKDQLSGAPPDVIALAGREVACRHWLNVEITDQESDALVEHALGHLRCDSLPAEMVTLRRKYAQSKSVLKALDTARDLGP
jgi:hypothetical protein